ncbi:MAG: sodium:proton exchanger, partial [Pseudomonadota bacterium]|nr:sodium:proton exchanger [Pseudomonadota bacterium]
EYDGLDVALLQREMFESAVVMAREALIKLGISERETGRVEREYRQRDDERLQAQSGTGDIHAAKHRMFAPERPLADEPAQNA